MSLKKLYNKIFGYKVNTTNTPTTATIATTGMAQQPPQHVYAGQLNGQLTVGNPVYHGGVLGGGYQVTTLASPNFGGISIQGGSAFTIDTDSNITGVPIFHRASFDTRKENELDAYYGDSFKLGEEIFSTTFDLSVGKNEFHFLVWQALWGDAIRDYGFLMLMPKPQTILAFTTRESRDQFVSWFEVYRERYPDRNTNAWRVPPIRQGRTGGCFADRKEFSEVEVVQVWAWIIGHCAGSAAFLPNFILFDNENDAVAYRLRWG